LISWRSLKKAGEARKIGLYDFGAAAHIIAQICTWEGREVYAFTRKGDLQAQSLPRNSVPPGRAARRKDRPRNWTPPSFSLRWAILYQKPYEPCAKVPALFCGGIHMSEIPSMPYATIWGERELLSVANLTRQDARDFFPIAAKAGVWTTTSAIRWKRRISRWRIYGPDI
jgi:alcohol dehydrogenase, propanol-preferring